MEIAAGYLEVESDTDFDYRISSAVPGVELDREALAARCRAVRVALNVSPSPFYERAVGTFFGPATLHEVLERCTWHVAQHVRQQAMLLEGLDIAPDQPLAASDLDGLPLPAGVWDG